MVVLDDTTETVVLLEIEVGVALVKPTKAAMSTVTTGLSMEMVGERGECKVGTFLQLYRGLLSIFKSLPDIHVRG